MARDSRHTEFGGGPGEPQRREDGSSKPLSVGEQARILRQVIKRDLPSTSIPRQQSTQFGINEPETSAYQPDVDKIADLDAKTNRYSREVDPGESVS